MLAALSAGLPAPAAHAHLRTGAIAVDYRATVLPLPGPLAAVVKARVYKSDQALGLTVESGHTVVVLGYLGEPFLRIDRSGVAVNAHSPTAAAVGLLNGVAHGRIWRARSDRRTVVWHDARLRRLAAGVERRPWAVPLVVDGTRVRLEGEIWRVGAPRLWVWIAFGTPFVAAAAALLYLRRPRWLRVGAAAFGALTAAATIANVAGFVIDPEASSSKWVLGGNEAVLAAAGLAAVALGSKGPRIVASGGLGLLGLFAGLADAPVFVHGVVLSALPATATRAGAAVMFWAGAAATAAAAFFLEPENFDLP